VSGTPTNDDRGIYLVNISVDDGNGGWAWTEFEVTVIDTNDPPTILTENITTANEDEQYYVDYNATDIDGDTFFQWSMMSNASWLNIDKETGNLTGTPGNDDVGISYVNVTVKDTRNGYTHQNFSLEVINVNDPPEWLNEPKDATVKEGEVFIFDLNATDIDVGDTLVYNISTNPNTDISIDPDTGLIKWLGSTENLAGEYLISVMISATDGDVTIFSYFDINIIPKPPSTVSLVSPENNEIVSLKSLKLNWAVDIEEDEKLTFDVYLSKQLDLIKDFNEAALFARGINETSLALIDLDIGAKYYWTVIPFNGIVYGGCTDGIFSFEINNPPTLLDISSQKIMVDKEFVLDVNANDMDPQDANNLVYSLSSEPSGMTIDASTGTIRWTPNMDQLGRHSVRIIVSDGADETSQKFTIEVIKNDAESKPEETNFALYSLLAIVIVVIMLILVLFMLLKKKKKGDKELGSDPSQAPQPMLENQIPLEPQIEGQYPQMFTAPMMGLQEQE
jgi:hypothetical protein